jgi:hypothetical protein
MANQPLSGLSQVFQNGYSTADVMLMLDPTDTTMASTGTDKGVTVATWLAEYLHAGPGIALTPGSTGVTIGTSPAVLYLPGPPYRTHVNHGFFWPQQVSGSQVNLGSAFWWEAWVAPLSGSYLISDGNGGSHALLWGFDGVPGPVTGNLWNGTAITQFYDSYSVASGEWIHIALGWDGTYVTMYCNGIVTFYMLWSGPRTSPGASACGPLFVGGSDHSNLGAKLAFIRGWDQYNPLAGSPWNPFIPERFPFRYALSSAGAPVPCDFFCDYTAPAGSTCLDTSPAGYNSGAGWRTLHHGTLGNDLGNNGVITEWPLQAASAGAPTYYPPWMFNPLPSWVIDSGSPMNVALGSSPAPTGTVMTPRTVPSGAKVFDSFQRANQTFAFQTNPSLGSTEGGSLGPLVWSQGSGGAYGTDSPNYCSWGILGGQVVPLGIGWSVAWVNTASATQDVRITRSTNQLGTPSAQGFCASSGATALACRVQDASNYWGICVTPTSYSVGPQGSYYYTLFNIVAGTVTNLQSATVALGAAASLRLTASGTTITAYYGTDGVPGTWTQLAQTTSSTLETATGAGITTGYAPTIFLNVQARFNNFTAF